MCQVSLWVGGGAPVITEQIVVTSIAMHGQIASLLALLSLASSIGAGIGVGIGNSISGAIWQNTIYAPLLEHLPDESKELAAGIFADLETQLSYPFGYPVRDATMQAYGIAQQRMCIAGTAVLVVAIVAVAMWKDVKVSQFKQAKGRVL